MSFSNYENIFETVLETALKQFYICVFSADASTYAHYLFNTFDSSHSGSIKFEVPFLFIYPLFFTSSVSSVVIFICVSAGLCDRVCNDISLLTVSFSLSGLCSGSVHLVERNNNREVRVDLQPVRH